MKKILTIVLASALLGLSPFALGCDYPLRAEIPNGGSASKDDMLAGQQSVKTYMAAMEEYLDCIAKNEDDTLAEMQEISDEERANRTEALAKKHNAAIEEMELIAARFNEEVRAYKDQAE